MAKTVKEKIEERPLEMSILEALRSVDRMHISDIIIRADTDSIHYKGQTVSIILRRLMARGVVERERRGFYRLSKTGTTAVKNVSGEQVRHSGIENSTGS